MTLTERIQELAAEKGFNFASIERELHLGRGTIRKWDENIPSADKLLKVANLLNTNSDWSLTGEGEMYKSDLNSKAEPKKGQIIFNVIGYGGKSEVITISQEDYEAAKPLLERMRERYNNR